MRGCSASVVVMHACGVIAVVVHVCGVVLVVAEVQVWMWGMCAGYWRNIIFNSGSAFLHIFVRTTNQLK